MEPINLNIHVYSKMFIFENNLRKFIKAEMIKKYGPNWFDKINTDIQDESKKQEQKIIDYLSTNLMNPNPLNYLFLSDLKKIILDEWTNVFYQIFKNADHDLQRCKNKLKDKLFELEIIRNILAHNHLLDEKLNTQMDANVNFFKSYLSDYDEQIYSSVFADINIETKVEIINKIKEHIRRKENIPIHLLSKSQKYVGNEIFTYLKNYNDIPKTRDKKIELDEFINKVYLLKKLEII